MAPRNRLAPTVDPTRTEATTISGGAPTVPYTQVLVTGAADQAAASAAAAAADAAAADADAAAADADRIAAETARTAAEAAAATATANMPAQTIKGNNHASLAQAPQNLTVAQTVAMLRDAMEAAIVYTDIPGLSTAISGRLALTGGTLSGTLIFSDDDEGIQFSGGGSIRDQSIGGVSNAGRTVLYGNNNSFAFGSENASATYVEIQPGLMTVKTTGGNGSVVLSSGDLTNPGYIGFYTPDGVRRGYIGWEVWDNTLSIVPENGWVWGVDGDLHFPDFLTGIKLAGGGKLTDLETGGPGGNGRTAILASNDGFDVITENGSNFIFTAYYTSPRPLFKGIGVPLFDGNNTYTGRQIVTAPNYAVSSQTTESGGAGLVGYSASGTHFGIVGYSDQYSFYGNGTLRNITVGGLEVFRFDGTSGDTFAPATGIVHMEANMGATTGNTANMWINSTVGNIARSTSSIQYKKDIEPLENDYADAFLQLEPIWYRSNELTIDNPKWSWYGFSAEDVAKIDPRLVQWAHPHKLDENGKRTRYPEWLKEPNPRARLKKNKEGVRHPKAGQLIIDETTLKPEGVQYERLIVLAQSVIKRQQTRIEELERNLAVVMKHLSLPASAPRTTKKRKASKRR